MQGPPIVAGTGRGARVGALGPSGGQRDGSEMCRCRQGPAQRGPKPALQLRECTRRRHGWYRCREYRCRDLGTRLRLVPTYSSAPTHDSRGRLGQALRGPKPALQLRECTRRRHGWYRCREYRCRDLGTRLRLVPTYSSAPTHDSRGRLGQAQRGPTPALQLRECTRRRHGWHRCREHRCRDVGTRLRLVPTYPLRSPPPRVGEGPGERGRNLAGTAPLSQPACALPGIERPELGAPQAQRVTTSRCIGASLASSLFWAANGTPLACIASCRISTRALNSPRRISRPSCDSAMLRPL